MDFLLLKFHISNNSIPSKKKQKKQFKYRFVPRHLMKFKMLIATGVHNNITGFDATHPLDIDASGIYSTIHLNKAS